MWETRQEAQSQSVRPRSHSPLGSVQGREPGAGSHLLLSLLKLPSRSWSSTGSLPAQVSDPEHFTTTVEKPGQSDSWRAEWRAGERPTQGYYTEAGSGLAPVPEPVQRSHGCRREPVFKVS